MVARFFSVSSLAVLAVSLLGFNNVSADKFSEMGFAWSSAGLVPNKPVCVRWLEAADAIGTWLDNYLCMNQDIGMVWSSAGPKSSNDYKCTQIIEIAEPTFTTWTDNYLCIPKNSKWAFTWTSSTPADKSNCVHIYEAADPHTWNDNYLCAYYDDSAGMYTLLNYACVLLSLF